MTAATATQPRTRPTRTRGQRVRRVLLVIAIVLVVVVAGLLFWVAWFFSGVALTVAADPTPPVRVAAVDGGAAIELPDSPETRAAGLHAVRHPDGWGIMSGEPTVVAATVVRAWRDVEGTLSATPVDGYVDSDVYIGSPAAVDLAFQDVTVTSDIGDLPTWLVPAPDSSAVSDTWVVFAHGRGGSRDESLRYLNLWHDLGHPVLVPAYRNDPGAPADPRGWYGLGETEWRDIDAAVAYALDNGAERVVLAGWSMGAAITMQVLDRSEHADAVAAVVLDAPVLDWRDTFAYQGSLFRLPSWLTSSAVLLVEQRSGIDFDDYDWVTRASEVRDVPIYLVHSSGDLYVPNGPSVAFAAARPDIVTFVESTEPDHTREWNVDPEGYEASMRAWFEAEVDGR